MGEEIICCHFDPVTGAVQHIQQYMVTVEQRAQAESSQTTLVDLLRRALVANPRTDERSKSCSVFTKSRWLAINPFQISTHAR